MTVYHIHLPANSPHSTFNVKVKTDAGPLLSAQQEAKLDILIMKLADAIEALNGLSTAADSLSLKSDNLIAKAQALIDALANANLTPEQQAAVDAANLAITKSTAAGAAVDAKVLEIDEALGTPAPAGEPA